MAKIFTPLPALLVVIAIAVVDAESLTTPTPTTTTGPPTTSGAVTTPGPPTTSGAVTTTTPGPPTTSGAVTTTTPGPPTTSGPVTTTTPGPPTTSGAVTTTTPGPPTTSGAVTTTTPGPPTTSGAVTTTTPGPPTTSGPVTTTTPGPPTTSSPVTTTPGPATTTTPGPPTTTTLSPPPTTTEAPNPCDLNPCGAGSTCAVRFNQSFVCLCLPGDSYNPYTSSCQRVKVFPGQLNLPDFTYTEDLSDKKSQAFAEASLDIITSIENVTTEEFFYATVLELRKSNTKRASGSGVEASVELVFEANALATEETVINLMKEASSCSECVLKGSNFDAKGLCESKPCNELTTNCESKDGGFICSCADGYIPTTFSNRICLECPSGTKAKDSVCVACPFGQTGFKCEDNRLLVVVIVASVVGGLLLITLILLPIVAVKTKKKTPKHEDYGKPYVSHSVAKVPPATSNVQNGHSTSFHGATNGGPSNVGVPRIPRATTTSNWDSRTNLEMTPSNSRQNLIHSGKNTWVNDDYDDTFTYDQSRPQGNLYSQNQPQRNPYAQNRAVNPYAQSQGNSNPYM